MAQLTTASGEKCEEHRFGNYSIRLRSSDGYFNANDLYAAGRSNELLSNLISSERVKENLKRLAREMYVDEHLCLETGFPFIDVTSLGSDEADEIYVHPKLTLYIGVGLSLKTATRVLDWTSKYSIDEYNRKIRDRIYSIKIAEKDKQIAMLTK